MSGDGLNPCLQGLSANPSSQVCARLWVAVGSPRVRVKGLVTGVKGGKQIFQRVQNILVIKYSPNRQHTL